MFRVIMRGLICSDLRKNCDSHKTAIRTCRDLACPPTGACTLSRFPPNKFEEFRRERGVQRPRNCWTQPINWRRRVLSMGGDQNGESY
jgi:hypothetical protein